MSKAINFSIITIALIFSITTSVWADKLSGPFGLIWGSSIKDIPYETILEIDPNNESQFPASGDLTKYYVWRSCRNLGLDSAESFSDYSLNYTSEIRDSYDYLSNAGKFDATLDGRIKTIAVTGKILGATVPICVSYFDDHLQSVQVTWENLYDSQIIDAFDSGFSSKYGKAMKGPTCMMNICVSAWWDEASDVSITNVVSKEWKYSYAPILSQKVIEWQKFYDGKAKDAGENIDL